MDGLSDARLKGHETLKGYQTVEDLAKAHVETLGKTWTDGLPEDLKGNEVLTQFKTVEDLAKAHVEALGKLPAVPEKPEAYEIAPIEGVPVDEAFVGQVKTWAHEAGMSQDQLAKFTGKYMEAQKAFLAQAQAQADADFEASQTALKKEWGGQYDANLAKANRVMRLVSEQDAEYIKQAGLGIDPAFIRIMQRIGELVSDDVLEPGGRQTSPTQMQRTQGGLPQLDFPSMK
jgi:hypothetical protein